MYASHDSFTGYKPTKWWMWLFRPFEKTQRTTIPQQMKHGVRYFDIRVRFKKNGDLVSCHGLSEYQANVMKTVKTIEENGCYYRIILENIIGKRKTKAGDIDRLKEIFLTAEHKACYYVADKKYWKGFFNPHCDLKAGELNQHKNFRNYKFLPVPRLFVKQWLTNKLRHSQNLDEDRHMIYFYDFVDIKK